jgi:mono/diheme cytochrome c family protein
VPRDGHRQKAQAEGSGYSLSSNAALAVLKAAGLEEKNTSCGSIGLFWKCALGSVSARHFAAIVALVAHTQLLVTGQSLPPTVWGPPEDPALACAEADQSRILKPGEMEAVFTYRVTNVTKEEAEVVNVISSCSCATPKHPPMPWRVAAGESVQFQIVMNVHGKTGTVIKTAVVETRKGVRPLTMRVTIPTAATNPSLTTTREKNMQVAAADRQAVFKGDCARCHATPSEGLTGRPLYTAACAVCHEAEHRASMVPDLKTLEHPTNREYWLQMISQGKPGTLMPAFAREHNGPLTSGQIESLAEYLAATLSPRHPSGPAPNSAPSQR